MIVTPIQGAKGDPIAEIDGILCLFDRKGLQPQARVPVEVMISHALPYRWHPRYAEMSAEEKGRHPPTIAFRILRPGHGRRRADGAGGLRVRRQHVPDDGPGSLMKPTFRSSRSMAGRSGGSPRDGSL